MLSLSELTLSWSFGIYVMKMRKESLTAVETAQKSWNPSGYDYW
jgi:hypothetical protein